MNEAYQKKRPSCLGVLVASASLLGVLLAVIDGLSHLVDLLLQLPQHFVIQISGIQISIGITVIITLLILFLMGLSFTLGAFYLVFVVFALFTKKKIPLLIRPFAALSFPFFQLTNWIYARKYGRKYKAYKEQHPPGELSKRLLVSFQDQKEKKSDTSSSNH